MTPALSLQNVVKHFGNVRAVDGVSFSVAAGECHGLIGANGAGKTTTFSLICGFLRPNTGEIQVMGADPRRDGSLKRRAGVLPQDAVLPATWQVGRLLRYWAELSGLTANDALTESRRVLEQVGLSEVWGRRAGTLSHGMGKRLALAQALIGSPPLLLLDEPTAGLDPKVAAEIRQIIRTLRGAHAILISSHNLRELEELCDGATILDRGHVVSSGRMGELTGQSGELRIQVVRGGVPIEALRALGLEVSISEHNLLRIVFPADAGKPEDIIAKVLPVLLAADVRFTSVQPGHSLEERVLKVT